MTSYEPRRRERRTRCRSPSRRFAICSAGSSTRRPAPSVSGTSSSTFIWWADDAVRCLELVLADPPEHLGDLIHHEASAPLVRDGPTGLVIGDAASHVAWLRETVRACARCSRTSSPSAGRSTAVRPSSAGHERAGTAARPGCSDGLLDQPRRLEVLVDRTRRPAKPNWVAPRPGSDGMHLSTFVWPSDRSPRPRFRQSLCALAIRSSVGSMTTTA